MTQHAVHTRARVYRDEASYPLQDLVDERYANGALRTLLDAGCGFQLPVDLPSDVHLVGIDVSEEAMAGNANADEKIIGDIQTYSFAAETYDAIICWYVLEHVPHPRMAMLNMAGALRSGGDLIIAIPYLWSLKGILTKLTPHRFHVWVYAHIFKHPNAGAPGIGPFRTYLHRDLAPRRLTRLMADRGFAVVHERLYGDAPEQLPRSLRSTWRAIGRFAGLLTGGRWKALEGEYIVVFRKRG